MLLSKKLFRTVLIFLVTFLFLSGLNASAQSDQLIPVDVPSDSEFDAALNNNSRQFSKLDFEFELPDDLQRDLPQADAREVRQRERRTSGSGFNISFLGGIFQIIFWGILAAALIFIAYAISSEIIRARRNFAPKSEDEELPDVPVYTPDEEQARVLLEDADKLAAAGKFEEAVHILLFRSIQDISAKRPHYVKRSLTSREISALPILTQKAKDGFSTIGRLVENSFFGGKPLGADDYETSKAAYKSFAFEKVAR